MEIRILQGIAGAKEARGIAVIIDVFRAFSVECAAFSNGVKEIFAVGDIETARSLAGSLPGALLVGERNGVMCERFDCGNSPSELVKLPLRGKTIVHTTSAGTQGIANADGADVILPGCLCNARAIARYILAEQPKVISLVCMGWNATQEAEEDTLCAHYIKALLEGKEPDIAPRLTQLAHTAGAKFFDPKMQAIFPMGDFPMCVAVNSCDFVLVAQREGNAFRVTRA